MNLIVIQHRNRLNNSFSVVTTLWVFGVVMDMTMLICLVLVE